MLFTMICIFYGSVRPDHTVPHFRTDQSEHVFILDMRRMLYIFSADCENYSIRGFRTVIFMPGRLNVVWFCGFTKNLQHPGRRGPTPCLILYSVLSSSANFCAMVGLFWSGA